MIEIAIIAIGGLLAFLVAYADRPRRRRARWNRRRHRRWYGW